MKENKLFPNTLPLRYFGRVSSVDISLNILQAIKETGLNGTLKKEGFSGLIPQTTCCLHIAHNAFRKGLNIQHVLGKSEELAFDMLHWFKNAPCKHKAFPKLEQEMDMKINQSLFLRHINSWWITLLPAIERILAQLPAV